MKTKNFIIAVIGALLVLAAFLPSAPRDHTAAAAGTVTLMSGQTRAGVGLASVTLQATPAPTGAETYFLQYVASAPVSVEIQASLDGGTSWSPLHVFGRDVGEVWSMPSCACAVRAWKSDTTTATASVFLSVNGAPVPLAPSYSPTPTNTPTKTATVTPTHP